MARCLRSERNAKKKRRAAGESRNEVAGEEAGEQPSRLRRTPRLTQDRRRVCPGGAGGWVARLVSRSDAAAQARDASEDEEELVVEPPSVAAAPSPLCAAQWGGCGACLSLSGRPDANHSQRRQHLPQIFTAALRAGGLPIGRDERLERPHAVATLEFEERHASILTLHYNPGRPFQEVR